MKALKVVSIVLAVLVIAGLGFVYGGIFNVAADDPHWGLTQRLLEVVRERSVATRATGLAVPPLDDPNLIAMGAEHYSEMCTGCHLAPGQEDTELRAGLHPKPPNLAEHGLHGSPEQTFWIVKHGFKMTGMPAWGKTHDDRSIWGMVAFLRKLPELSPAAYQELIEASGGGHHHDSEGHPHVADDEESGHSHGDASTPQQREEAEGHGHGEDGHDHQHGEADTKDQEHSHGP